MKNKRLRLIFLIVTVLLLVPLIAMQFTDEVNWSLEDFVIAGLLLGGTGLLFDAIVFQVKNVTYRTVLTIVLLIVLLLIWAELAVGIFGSPLGGS